MGNSTPTPDSPVNEEAITEREVYAFAEECFQHYWRGAVQIITELSESLNSDGYFHGRSIGDVAKSFSQCVSEVTACAQYLASRGVIDLSFDESEGRCDCVSCRADASWMRLPFRMDVDRRDALTTKRWLEQDRREKEEREARKRQRTNCSEMRPGVVYLLKCADRYKIGIATDLERRLNQLNGQQAAYPVQVVHHVSGPNYYAFEQELHKRYDWDRVHGEWFAFDADTVAAVIESMNEWTAKHAANEGGE